MSSIFLFVGGGGENLKPSLNDAFKNPLLDSINIIFIYTINFLNILDLICVYLSHTVYLRKIYTSKLWAIIVALLHEKLKYKMILFKL